MEPVCTDSHGYKVKQKFEHLLPEVYGRPRDYVMVPFVLPDYNPVLRQAIQEIEACEEDARSYYGSFNRTFM